MDKNGTFSADLSLFEFQVAGHSAKSLTGNVGILKHKDGYILKPINKSPQGDVEISFYERLSHDKDLLPLKRFTPEFFGQINLKINNSDVRFLKLKDVTNGFLKPCVMDVKIGKRTWDPNATPEKQAAEDAKYVEIKKAYGFCIPGYIVFNLKSRKYERFGKNDGKKLGKDSTLIAFRHFFNIPNEHSDVVIRQMIDKLNELLSWWNVQKIVHIFSSSVLLIYDAEKIQDLSANTNSNSLQDLSTWIKVYAIDFAHVFPANEKDFNYFSGLSKLLEVLNMLL